MSQVLAQRKETTMESWKHTWRKGVVPLLSTRGLEALRDALQSDDARLLQGATCVPPPLQCVQDWPVEAACLWGFAGWIGEGFNTVAEVESYFAQLCFDCDQMMGEPAACRWFLNWFDDTPRDEMRKELLPEVQKAIRERGNLAGPPETVFRDVPVIYVDAMPHPDHIVFGDPS